MKCIQEKKKGNKYTHKKGHLPFCELIHRRAVIWRKHSKETEGILSPLCDKFKGLTCWSAWVKFMHLVSEGVQGMSLSLIHI